MAEPCTECHGRGVIPFATEDVPCAACHGTGNASGRGKTTEAATEATADADESSEQAS